MGSGSVARRAGEAVEDRVLERTAFVHVPDGEVTWYDAETPPGFPVEIKGAVRERSKGDRTAPGLWWIQKRHHDRPGEDRIACLFVYDDGQGQGLLLNDDEAAVAWAQKVYERYRAEATRVSVGE